MCGWVREGEEGHHSDDFCFLQESTKNLCWPFPRINRWNWSLLLTCCMFTQQRLFRIIHPALGGDSAEIVQDLTPCTGRRFSSDCSEFHTLHWEESQQRLFRISHPANWEESQQWLFRISHPANWEEIQQWLFRISHPAGGESAVIVQDLTPWSRRRFSSDCSLIDVVLTYYDVSLGWALSTAVVVEVKGQPIHRPIFCSISDLFKAGHGRYLSRGSCSM